MAIDAEKIRQQLRQFTKSDNATMLGEVVSVDKEAGTCVLKVDAADWYDVRLQCVTGTDGGVLIEPKVGSKALALDVNGGDGWMIVQTAEVESIKIGIEEKIEVEIGDVKLGVEKNKVTIGDDTEVEINGGKNGGMVKVSELVKKLNTIENSYNTLVQALMATSITLAPSGSYPLAQHLANVRTISPTTSTADIEDGKIKH